MCGVLAHYIVAVVTANVFCSFQLLWFICREQQKKLL